MNSPKSLRRNALIGVILCLSCTGFCAHPKNNPGISADSDFAGEAREKITIEGVMGINDTSTGCWYLSTDDGRLYEPIFCVTEPFELKQGLRVRVYGYIEPDAPQACSFGPVFYAEQTQVIADAENSDYSGLK